jgi:DNA invertase Pin-like site-specific DNA recombinase
MDTRVDSCWLWRRERQPEGIADAKARDLYKGRKPSIDPENQADESRRHRAAPDNP